MSLHKEEFDIYELKKLHDKAFNHNKITRERAADDTVFYFVTNWDETVLGESSLGYKGEFNILRKAGRQIIGDLRANPVQVDFEPTDENREDAGEVVDGLYRASTRLNTSIEAFDNANQESVVCGLGGWELITEYDTNIVGDNNQKITRRPIHEFNNNAFPDPSATLMDKSDAMHWSILVPYSKEGMETLAEELTGEAEPGDTSNFKMPEHSYTFPWISGKDEIHYAVRFYRRIETIEKVLTFSDPAGAEIHVLSSAIEEMQDELLSDGYTITGEKEIKRYKVKLYIANGYRILSEHDIAGQHIPVVPQYGERAFVEGEEHWEGCTRLAKDPQRLRNFQMSYLADIVSRSPRPKPMFFPEQLAGFKHMYEETGAENNYPYLLQNMVDVNGNPLPLGPAGQMPEQNVPNALIQSIQLSREAVSDVAPANLSQDMADVDLSGEAIRQMQARLDDQSVVYQQNRKHALRRDGEIYASMGSEVFDCPRQVTTIAKDGSRTKKRMMEPSFDESGDMTVKNDITCCEFEVYAEIGPNYTTRKEQTVEQLGKMAVSVTQINPGLAEMLILKQTELIDGVNLDDVREYANKQLLIKGYRQPDEENSEDMQIVQQAAQNNQPDANTLLAMAEQAKADANMADVQRKTQLDQFNAKTQLQKQQILQFDASTRRMAVQVDAQEAAANIDYKRIDAATKRMNVQLRARVN